MATPISLGFVRRVAFLIVAFLIGAAAARTPLQAQHTNCVSCPNINISPDGGTATHADNGHYSAVFKAKNGGTGTGTWTIAPNLTGGMTVDSIAPDLEDGLILSTGDSAFITVYYFLATNPGTITLTASGTTNGETGSITVTPNYSVAVTPDSGTRTRLGLSTGLVDTFTVKNAGANSDTYNLTCPVTGQVLTCTLNVPSLALASGASGKAIATYSTGVTGSGTLKVHAVAVTGGESDDGTYYLTVTGTGAPALSSKPQNANYRRLSQCLAACFDVVYQYSTPSYVSLNTARSASLVYNSSTAKPTPVISLNADTGGAATIRPSSYKMEVRLVSTGALLTLLNGSTAVYYNASSNGPTRLTAVLDAQANSLPTGAYAVNVTITAAYTGASYASVSATRFLVDDESHSALGVGVGLAGFQRLYPVSGTNSVVITEGDGSIIYFARSSPTAAFLTPGGSSDSLSYNSGTSTYRRTSLDGGYIEFNASGRMTKSVDRYGNTLLTVGYLGAPLDSVPKTFTDFKSKVIQLCFSANCLGTGKLQKIMVLNSGAGVRNVTTTVDGSGRLIKIVDPDGLSDSLGYNGSGLLTTAWNRAHSATDFKYDAINRIDSSQAPSISLYSGSSGRPTVTLVAADRLGWQPTVAGTSLGTAKAALLPDSVLATITDPLGNATRIALDGFGAPLRITDPYGAVTTIARDTASRVTRTRQPNGHIVGYSYSGFLPTMVYDSTTSQSTLFQYTPAHNIRTLSGSAPRQDFLYRLGTDGAPVGALKKVYIGASANNDTTVTGGKLLETHKVDGLGRDSSIVDAQSHGTHTSFEATWGNTSAIRDSLGNVTAFHYDSVGRNDSILAPHGLASATQFGSMNQVVQSKDPLGHVTLFKYDSLFNLIRVQDPNGWVNKYDYNAAGVLVVRHSPADTTKSDSSWIDLAGNVRRAHTLKGDSLAMSYDKVGRLLIRLAKVDSIHVVADTFRYDTTQMLWRVAANANAYDSLAVDVRGRLVKSLEKLHGQSYTTTYTYDAVDRLIARSLSKTGSSSYTSAMNYVFGATGTLDSLCANAKCVTMHYTSNFLVDTVTYNRGSLAKWTLTQQFDGANAVDSQTYSDTLLRGFNLKVVRDSLEREKWRTSPTVGYAKRKFSYDLDGRLLSATDSGTTVNSVPTYTYDAGDNRRYDSTGSTVTITAGNRLSWDLNGGTYTYDASGNMTCNGILGGGSCASGLYHWDQFGQLDSLVNSSGTALRFGYDALGRRVKKEIVGGTTIWFAHVGDQVVLDVNGATDSVKTEYSWYPGVDHLLSMKTSTGLNLAAITDPDNGTIRGMARFDSGGLVKRFMERTWGDNLDTGTVVRYHFAGAELDQESGLYYMRARYYNPAVGRFISEDPIGVAGGLNLYAYAGNDPVNARDPEGLDEAEPCPEFTTEWTRAGPIIVCKRPVQLPDIVTIGHTYHRQVDELPPIGPGAFTNALHAYGRAFNAYGRAVTHIYNFLSSGAEDVSIDCEDAQFAAFEHLAVDAYAARGLMVGGVLERIGAGAIGGIQAHLDRNAGSFIPGIPFARSLGQEAFSCGL